MINEQMPNPPEREDDLDYSWESLRGSAQDIGRKSKLIAKNLPGELADAADDYLCSKAMEVKESVTGRVNRARDRLKRRLVLKALSSIDFGKRIVFFRFLKLKLDRLRRKVERLNDENELVQLRCDIGKRMIQLHRAPSDPAETSSPALG
jgi:hypothetical protein